MADRLSVGDAADAIEHLWQEFAPLVHERLAAIALLIADPNPDDEAVERARTSAHALAGALGSYGRKEAGVVAGTIDELLSSGSAAVADRERIHALYLQLKGALGA